MVPSRSTTAKWRGAPSIRSGTPNGEAPTANSLGTGSFMEIPLAQVADVLQLFDTATLLRADGTAPVAKGWSIDSRTIAPGDVFFAVPGEHNDGHTFVREVFAKGAVAAVVSHCVADAGGRQLRVENTVAALQRLAA